MAKYTVNYSCGHEGVISLFGKGKDREKEIERCKCYRLCPDCYSKAKRKVDKENGIIARTYSIAETGGRVIVITAITGDTYDNKAEIRSAGFRFAETYAPARMGINIDSFRCWSACDVTTTREEAKEALKKHHSMLETLRSNIPGISITESEDNDLINSEIIARIFNENNEKKESEDKKQNAVKGVFCPTPPPFVEGKRWNGILYGKGEEKTIYLNNKPYALDSKELEEIKEYIDQKKEYENRVSEIKSSSL